MLGLWTRFPDDPVCCAPELQPASLGLMHLLVAVTAHGNEVHQVFHPEPLIGPMVDLERHRATTRFAASVIELARVEPLPQILPMIASEVFRIGPVSQFPKPQSK
jgi:hypothetical protein